jgi:hypothetical protein
VKPLLTNRAFKCASLDITLCLVDWKYPNNCEVIVAIYPLVIGIWVNEDAPRIAIGKANVSHQKKILDNANKIASIPKRDQDEGLNPIIIPILA